MNYATRPPEKLSGLIELAIGDARKLDRDSYAPLHTRWHRPAAPAHGRNRCTIAWCDGTATTLKGNGRALNAAAAAHREITDPAKRRDRRPVLCVSAAETVSGKTAGPEIIRYTADGRVCTIEEGDLDEDRRLASVHVVIGATEPSGETLDGLDDTACRSFAQGARRQVFIANQVRPHDDEPRYYFVRRLQVPQTEAENGEPGSRPPGARDRTR